jgi:hypothetical protein
MCVVFKLNKVRDLNEDLDNRRLLVKQLLKQPITAKFDIDKKAVEDRVKSLVSAVSAIAAANSNSNGFAAFTSSFIDSSSFSSGAKTTSSDTSNGGNTTSSTPSKSSFLDDRTETGGLSGAGQPLTPFSFALTPEESLLQITLRENLLLKQRLAILDPEVSVCLYINT